MEFTRYIWELYAASECGRGAISQPAEAFAGSTDGEADALTLFRAPFFRVGSNGDLTPIENEFVETDVRDDLRACFSDRVSEPEHYIFPACENHRVDSTKPQKTWRTAWRALRAEAAKRAGDLAAKAAALSGADETRTRERAMKPFLTFRFHDLRHQAITEMAENGVADATLKAIAGHMSNEMMEHYSHVRMAKKKKAVAFLGGCMPSVSPSPKHSPTSQELESSPTPLPH